MCFLLFCMKKQWKIKKKCKSSCETFISIFVVLFCMLFTELSFYTKKFGGLFLAQPCEPRKKTPTMMYIDSRKHSDDI